MIPEREDIWRRRVEDLVRHSPVLLAFFSGPEHVYQLVSECFLQFVGHRDVLRMHQRDGDPVALLVMDLDRFKDINDTFGHHNGDLVLRQVGERLQRALRSSDTVARLGGDEFAIILPATDAAGATLAAQKITATLGAPIVLDGQSVRIGPSIGIALCPEHTGEGALLLRHADAAMYAAKHAGSRYALYDPEQDTYRRSRGALIAELQRAIDDGQLVLHYQPEINIKTGCPEHLEALVRWQHPKHGLLLPDAFIRLAEESGLIEPLTRWVLTTALQECRGWRAHLKARVAVNLSASNLDNPELAEIVTTALRRAGLPASSLTLEITESAAMAEPERAMRILAPLHEMGVVVALDDFGTGYSSLAYLERLPVDQIKIDRSFVRDVASNEHDLAIVRSVIDLGHSLGRAVAAEGVEDGESCRLLASMGCDCAQGYYVTPALPVAELAAWLRQRPAGHG